MSKRKIEVRIEDYKSYLEKYKTPDLDNKNVIFTNGGFPKFLNISEEIFDGMKTDYDIKNHNADEYLINFKSKSLTEYRFDLFREPNTKIWHISFSLSDSNLDSNYHNLTNKNESIDVFNRLIWILKDMTPKLDISEYCIGATGTKKDTIYEYMMKFVSGWEKRKTDQYDLGWAIYFKI